MNDDQWSKEIAELIADALVDGGLFKREGLPQAAEIIAEEIWTRLLCKDYPPGATDPSKRALAQEPLPRSPG